MMADTALQKDIDTCVTTGIYTATVLDELSKREKAIKTALSGIDKNMEKVAFSLYWIYLNKLYRAMGCESITDYALKTFDLGKSTTYSFISLVERFAAHSENGSIADKFDDKYKGYSSSKLSLLVNLTDEQIEESGITPDMSVRDIKSTVKRKLSDDASTHILERLEKKDTEGEPGSPEPDAQGTMTVKDNELSVPSTSEPETDDASISGYFIDIVINGERRPSSHENTVWGFINSKYIEDTLKWHPEVEELIIYRKK